jgi:hypothetical protein
LSFDVSELGSRRLHTSRELRVKFLGVG